MSRGSQIFLGIIFALAAAFMAWFADNGGHRTPAGSASFYWLAAFFGVIAVACLVEKGRAITLRIIGAVIFVVMAMSCYSGLNDKGIGRRVAGLVVIGIPCAFLAVTGKFPNWGYGGKVFGEKPKD